MNLENIDYHIIDICNLNCASCNHFSSLSKNANIISTGQAESDFIKLSKINDKFDKITILGGEALLSPYIIEIIELAVKYFPNKVKLITNGILVSVLRELKNRDLISKIELVITEYPFIDTYREFYDNIKTEFPTAIFYTFRHEHGFISEHLSYNKQTTDDTLLLNCDKRFKCVQYINGRLYICHYAGFLKNLESITNLTFTNEDSYIILDDVSEEEFDDFFMNYIPQICRHCMYIRKPYEKLDKNKWSRTKKEPSEWIK